MEAASGFRPHAGLEQTLKQFHLSSMSSLGGPAAFSARWQHETPFDKPGKRRADLPLLPSLRAQTPALLPGPLLIAPDRSTERCETVLERESVSCFVVGGEKRLCLPQILNSVLRDFTLQQINAVCDELHIYCSRCTAEQLEILKVMGILPFSAPSCGLITQTDSERLCNSLLHGGSLPSKIHKDRLCSSSEPEYTERAFKVYHECFGRGKGLFIPDLYTSPHAACIQCVDCSLVFSTHKFVVHSHKRLENRTCHWGFDSGSWRAYILLDRDYVEKEEKATLQQLLDGLKQKYDLGNTYKSSTIREHSPIPVKKSKQELSSSPSKDTEKQVEWLQCLTTSAYKDLKRISIKQRPSAFQPWSPTVPSTERAVPSHKHKQSLPKSPESPVSPKDTLWKNKQSGSQPSDSKWPRPTKCCPSGTDQPQLTACLTYPPQCDSDAEVEVDNCDEVPCFHSCTNGVVVEMCEGRHRPSAAPSLKRKALQMRLCSSLSSREARKSLLQDFVQMQVKQEETLSAALQAKSRLQQELEFLQVSKNERLRDAGVAECNLREDLERLRAECERKVHDANESCERLKRELEHERQMHVCDMGCEPSRLRAMYTTQIEELQKKLQQAKADGQQLREELLQEHEARQSLELVVLQLQQQLAQDNRKEGHFSQQHS